MSYTIYLKNKGNLFYPFTFPLPLALEINAVSFYKPKKNLCGLISTPFARPFLPKERLDDFYHVLAMEITSVRIVFDQWMHRVLAVTNRVALT